MSAAACLLAAVAAALTVSHLFADTLGRFEIDAEHAAQGSALYAEASDDWAESGGSGGEGVFLAGTGGSPDFLDCFGSDISVNPAADGTASFICDGSSDSRFDGNGGDVITEPERNVVSPGGKQTDDIWHIIDGGVTGKDDFSHAYGLLRKGDSRCDADVDADDPFFIVGGHRGDNEGDAFWGFELSQVAPAGLAGVAANSGGSLDLDFSRTSGDLLISFTLTGGGANPQLEVFTWNGTMFVPAVASCPGDPSKADGDSLLRTNLTDVQAPPWNVPVCDPTATQPANNCRVANGNAADSLIAPRDFNEAVVDLGALGAAGLCFRSLIFTSRSAHPLASADLKDVGGVAIDTCAPPPTPTPPPAPPQTSDPPPGTPPITRLPPTGSAPAGDSRVLFIALAGMVASAVVLSLRRARL